MNFKIESEHLNGLVVVIPEVYEDSRGFFTEVYRADKFRELSLPDTYYQVNHSGSAQGVLRGLHFQWGPPMGKIMRVVQGTAFLVAVDIRKGSPTLGKWFGVIVSSTNRKQVWAPAGFARGFYAMSVFVEIEYQCTEIYNSQCEGSILWNDPEIGIEWPVIEEPLLSDKDKKAASLKEWLQTSESDNFKYGEKQ